MRKSLFVIAAAMSIIAYGGRASAQDSMDATIDQYFKVMHTDESANLMGEKQTSALGGFIFSHNPNINLTQREAVLSIISSSLPQFRDAERAAYRNAIKTVYTEEELTKSIEFYSTPIGQSIISKARLFALTNDTLQKSIADSLVFPTIKQKLLSNDATKSLTLW